MSSREMNEKGDVRKLKGPQSLGEERDRLWGSYLGVVIPTTLVQFVNEPHT